MKIYRVTVEHTFFMVSDDVEVEAEECARQAVQEDSTLDLITDVEVTQLEEIPKEWANARPYGTGGNVRSCADWIKHIHGESNDTPQIQEALAL